MYTTRSELIVWFEWHHTSEADVGAGRATQIMGGEGEYENLKEEGREHPGKH